MPINCLITTSSGICPTLRRELTYLRYKSWGAFDTGAWIQCELKDIPRLNVRLRTASKVWIELGEEKNCHSFETLFTTIKNIKWDDYIAPKQGLSINVSTYKSTLDSQQSIQSIAHKAVIVALTDKEDGHREVDSDHADVKIRVIVAHNQAKILINSSGVSLHERGWRTQQGEAPLKEHIAAALVLMTSRGYSQPLIDPYCGSGTILIEAAMIATNRAPGLQRNFAFEHFPIFSGSTELDTIRQDAEKKFYDKEYSLSGYDIDEHMIRMSQNNAKNAGVGKYISFKLGDSVEKKFSQEDTIITNPPYGLRIGHKEVEEIHTSLLSQGPTTKNMTVITGYEEASSMINSKYRKIKQAKNGKELVDILLYKHQ